MISELVAAATVGTAHRAVDVAALPASLRPDPMPADSAVAVLDAAALVALARRTVPPAPPHPAITATVPAPERVPLMPDVLRQIIGRVERHPAVLVEALVLIRRAGLRLHPDLVPGLLDDGRPEVVAATRPVSGEIGEFLMSRNPRWAAPIAADPTETSAWDEGTTPERIRWLRALRRTEPDRARELMSDSFSQEGSAVRAELLAVLADGLSPADQDFLLAAVGDRSRAVVGQALDLLTLLPDSPLCRDMEALAARHLKVGHRLQRTTFTVTEPRPAEFAPWPVPQAAPWTVLLGRIDPARWTRVFGMDLLGPLAAGADEFNPLVPGFRQAAVTFRHAVLARVLITGRFTVDTSLWSVLSAADAADPLDRLLADRRIRPDQVTAALSALPRPWPAPLARRLAGWLSDTGNATTPPPRQLWDLWASAAELPDCRELATLAREIAARAAGDRAAALVTRAGNAANLLTLRAVLRETLQETLHETLHETLCPPGGNP